MGDLGCSSGFIDRLYALNAGLAVAPDASVYSPGKWEGEQITLSCNAYLVRRGDGWIMWDTGIDDAVADEIASTPKCRPPRWNSRSSCWRRATTTPAAKARRRRRQPDHLTAYDHLLTGRDSRHPAQQRLANLGAVFAELAEDQGVYEEQRPQLREMAGGWLQALAGSERGYGERHPVTGGLLRELGAVLDAQGAAVDARPYRERAAECRRRNLRGTDAEAAATLIGIGKSLMAWGLYDEALEYLERALVIREDELGDRDFDTSAVLFKLGILHQLGGRNERAREYLQRALRVRTEICGETHQAAELVRENLRLLDG